MVFRRVRALLRGEDGFSVLESTVALVIVFGVLLTMMRTLDSGLRVLVETRRQAAASAFANELLERARSLEWRNTGLTADSNDDDCPGSGTVSGVGCIEWSAFLDVGTNGNGEYTFEGDTVIFVNPTQTFDPFLSFHEEVTRDNTPFDRFLFVTSFRDDPNDATTERYRKLTAIVRWSPPGGFPKEIRQVTYVARFQEPSIPFLKASAVFDGGYLTVSGNQPDGMGFVQGTERWAVLGAARPDLSATVELPDAKVSATTDYVSGAEVVATGTLGDVAWSDGTTYLQGPDRFEKLADDDFGSLPPPNDLWSDLTLPAWDISRSPPHDFRAREEIDTADWESTSQADATWVGGEVWSQHSLDDLPYSRMELRSARAVSAWFLEYSSGHNWKDILGLAGPQLSNNPYWFTLLWHGAASGSTLQYDATIDRIGTAVADRRTVADARWRGETVYVGADEAYFRENPAFLGWLRIRLPTLDADVAVGASGTTAPPALSGGTLEIAHWSPSAGSYQTVFSQAYDTVTSVQTIDIDASPNDGTFDPSNPLTHSLSTSGLPPLRYEVSALLTVNPAVISTAFNSESDRSDALVQVSNIVTAQVNYFVEDTAALSLLGDGRIFDVVLEFGLGGFDVNARYLNPEAS